MREKDRIRDFMEKYMKICIAGSNVTRVCCGICAHGTKAQSKDVDLIYDIRGRRQTHKQRTCCLTIELQIRQYPNVRLKTSAIFIWRGRRPRNRKKRFSGSLLIS